MPLPILGPLLDLAGKVLDRVIPDPAARAAATLELAKMEQNGELQAMAMQAKINEIEAASPDRFISGWRPAVGWVCAAGLAMAYVAGPAVSLVISLVGMFHGKPFVAPVVDMATLSPILLGMLGMAGLRTFEKVKDVEGNR